MNKDWLDIEVLEDYLDGKLDAKTMNRVEREALDDPFVAEALAGLSQSPKRALQSLSLLQKQLHERVAQQQEVKKTSVITWQRLSIAATAAVLFVAVSIMFWMKENNQQKELASRAKKVDVIIAPESPSASPPESASETTALGGAPPMLADKPVDKKAEKEIDKAIQAAKTNTYASRTGSEKSKRNSEPVAEQQLNEIAVVGFATQAKRSITGAVAANVLSGKIISKDDGQPLPGVSVKMDGANLVAVTDAKGEFRINADTSVKEGLIHADYIGFKKSQVLAKVNSPVNIALEPANSSLNEVVSISVAKVEKKASDPDRVGALGGMVSGIKIRGSNSVPNRPIMVSNPVGGWDKLFQYIKANNSFAKEAKTGQTVELSFKIDQEGSPIDIKVVKGADEKYEEEAIRLIINGPKWEKPMRETSRMTFKIDF